MGLEIPGLGSPPKAGPCRPGPWLAIPAPVSSKVEVAELLE
jgi:hypothetical protein